MSRRTLLATGIVTLWLGGLGVLAHRAIFTGQKDRLARAALFLAPGADYYEISNASGQIGFATSTIDTSAVGVSITDRVIARIGSDSAARHVAARSAVQLTRALRLRHFAYQLGEDVGPYVLWGTVSGDTLLTLVTRSGDVPPDTQRVRLAEPLLLPTMVPLAIALGDRPKVGASYTYQVFDPIRAAMSRMTVHIRAESLFVVPDSAREDSATARWLPAHQDTVRAWRIEQDGGRLLTGWVDESGRMVQAAPLPGFVMRRSAYEIAVLNWSNRTAGLSPPHAQPISHQTP